jgi:hypothetical protein
MASRARMKNRGVVGKLYRSTVYALLLSPLLAPGEMGEPLPAIDFLKKPRKPAAVVPSDDGQGRRIRRSTPALQGPPPGRRSQPAVLVRPSGRTTRSNTPAVADPPPIESLDSASAVIAKLAQKLLPVSAVLEPLEELEESPTHMERTRAPLGSRMDLRDSRVNGEAGTNLPATRLDRDKATVFPPTPLPRSGRHQTLFNEEALREAEAVELENDPDANDDDDDDEQLVGFGQPRSPFIRSPFVRSSFPRASNPPSTEASSDDEGQSRQARRDAKGKGRAIINNNLDDEELEDQLEELEDEESEDEPDEPSNAPGEKLPH